MKNYFLISIIEFKHFIRSKFKFISLILYALAIIYGCFNGYDLFKKYNEEINNINANAKSSINNQILQYEQIENGEIEKPRRDPTTPYWAIRYTHLYTFKYPSPMIIFSIGQSEQYGYYKYIKNWSTVFDSDLAEEIANPERLALGTLDFSFVFIFLTPMLLIILLFNIGGLEKDLGIDHLIYLNNISKTIWLIFRFLFYYILIVSLIHILILPFSILSGAISETRPFFSLSLMILLYVLFWFIIFYVINIFGIGSSDNAIKMIFSWLIFCIIIPGSIHQISSIKFPFNYMTDYIDTNRDKSDEIFDLPYDSLHSKLLSSFPDLKNTIYGSDTTLNKVIINRSLSGLINILNKEIASEIEERNEKKNQFLVSLNKINPVIYFQNKINSITKTDYYSFKQYRQEIQLKIDNQINTILYDTWNKVIVDKEKYLEYIGSF